MVGDIDLLANHRVISIEEVAIMSIAIIDLSDMLKTKESQLFQRVKVKWFKKRDANSGYFHASIKSKSNKNSILALKVGDRWIEGVSKIRHVIFMYFTEKFKEPHVDL